jgi:hypothetical protein
MAQVAKAPAFWFLRDQQPLSQEAFDKARRCRDWAVSLVEGREKYVHSNGLDAAIHLPHGVWEMGRGLYEAYRAVRDGGYEVYNHLRMFSGIFTGFHLDTLAPPWPRRAPLAAARPRRQPR